MKLQNRAYLFSLPWAFCSYGGDFLIPFAIGAAVMATSGVRRKKRREVENSE